MNTIKKILIPIDFSASAMAAVNYALGMTKSDRNIEFTLIYVLKENRVSDTHKKDLENLADELFRKEGITCNTAIRIGDMAEKLIETREELNIDLIVMGTGGYSANHETSNTIELLKKADCPLLVVPEKNIGFELKNIALAWDKQPLDETSNLGILHDMAKWYNAKVHLLTIDQEEEPHEIKFGEPARQLEYYMQNLDYRHSFPQNSDIELGISEYVKDKNIDVLAIMPRHHAVNTPPTDGKLTRVLAGNSNVPLLILD